MNNTITLWQLLQDQPVIVPMIQRDYAQGRKGKEHIREMFLKNLENCLGQGKQTTLDFVYGNLERGQFYPLDGQQRLTTLWLVHWYLAFRLGKLKEDKTRNILMQFSYQTRDSSRDFCKQLCLEMGTADPKIDDVVEYIKGQTWFFSEWTQDPTIEAMLRTLGGDKRGVPKENIQNFFDPVRFDTYWKNLTEESCIVFELMIIGSERLPISDDLYIKMNARGKKLTDFENFKADWVKNMRNDPALAEKTEDKDDKTYVQYYTEKLDQDWTDVFWNSRLASNPGKFDGNIDSIFFSFINRFALNQHCLKDKPAADYNSRNNPASKEEWEKCRLQQVFDVLYGTGLGKGKSPIDDSLIEYRGFDPYSEFLGKDSLRMLDKIFTQLKDDPHRLTELSFHGIEEDEEAEETSHRELAFHFLPQYSESTGLVPTTLKERIYFHAMCLFLEDPEWDRLEDWKRVVRNLVENAAIENQEAMIGCLREINGLGKALQKVKWDVNGHLADHALQFSSVTQLVNQWKEEQEKAVKMLEEGWKEKILTAEKYAFFRGSIRFLYTGADGKPDWRNFDTKFLNAKAFFLESNTVGYQTILRFLEQFSSFDDLNAASGGKSYFFTTIGFHARNFCWKKNILCNTDSRMIGKVHSFLMKEPSQVTDEKYRSFLRSRAVKYLSERSYSYKYRYHDSKDWGVLRDSHSTEGIYTSDTRLAKNQILLTLKEDGQIFFENEINLGNGFLWGKEISFQFGGREYCWFAEWGRVDWICLGTQKDRNFKWTDTMTKDDLLTKLQAL